LSIAFPDADSIRPLDFYLTPEQRSEIEQLAGAKLESNLITVYTGTRQGQPLGYALFDTHVVRTLPETLLLVLSPSGELTGVHLLAFYEPPEYAPPQPWLDRFRGWKADTAQERRPDVTAISGSTLSSRAAVAAVKRALAIYRTLLSPR
jgi:Na+-translocating ferredoxin:NAD+ oxidoreductase RnfG subunit